MAHRLELSIFQVQKVNMVGNVNDALHQIWKTYNFSPKSKHELQTVCDELETRLSNPVPVKGTRWIPHLRALETFIRCSCFDLVEGPDQYSAVAIHMESLAVSSRNVEVASR